MHPVNIFNCEESKLFKQGKTFHSELLKYFAERQIVLCHLDFVSLARTAKLCNQTRILKTVNTRG